MVVWDECSEEEKERNPQEALGVVLASTIAFLLQKMLFMMCCGRWDELCGGSGIGAGKRKGL